MKLKVLLIAAVAILASRTAEAGLKVYDVDARYRQEVYSALARILQIGPASYPGDVGKVALLPTGQILVDANNDVQTQVAAVVEAIAKKAAAEPSKASAASSELLRYWVLFGVPGQQATGAVPAALDGVVRELDNAHGNMSFSVLDTASLSSEPNDSAGLKTKTLQITQKVYPGHDLLNASIVINHEYQKLNVKIALSPGEYAVLSDSSVENDKGQKGLIAFVVNWPASR